VSRLRERYQPERGPAQPFSCRPTWRAANALICRRSRARVVLEQALARADVSAFDHIDEHAP
jgi:hypothetical protein